MGRLISTSDLHNIVMKRKTEYGRLATLIDNIVEEMVQETQTVDAIEIPKNITNGDMIKIMFPNIEIEGIGGEIKCIAAKNGTSYFALDWWNAPYKNSSN